MFLFNSPRSSDQSSVQNLSAQPSVTAAISNISARVALDASESLLSPSFAFSVRLFSSHVNGKRAQGSQDASSWSSTVTSQRCLNQPSPYGGGIIRCRNQPSPRRSLSGQLGTQANPSELSDDVKYFTAGFKTSGDSWDFKRFMATSHNRYWVICQRCRVQALSAAACALGCSCQGSKSWHQLEVSSELGKLDLSHDLLDHGSGHSSWFCIRESHHHLHDHLRRHDGRRSSSLGADSMSGVPSLSLPQHAHGHLRLASFMDEIMVFRAQVSSVGMVNFLGTCFVDRKFQTKCLGQNKENSCSFGPFHPRHCKNSFRRRITKKPRPRDSTEVAAVLQEIKGQSSSYQSGSNQCRSSGSLVRRRVA